MPCTRESLIADGACYQKLGFGRQRLAFRVWLEILQLAAVGGTDYSDNIDGLLADSKCLDTLNTEQRDVADIVIDAQNATDAGADVPTDMTDVMAAITCLQNFTDVQLDTFYRHLRCNLGPAAAQ